MVNGLILVVIEVVLFLIIGHMQKILILLLLPEMCHVTLMICPEQVMKATKAHSCDGEEDVSGKGAQIHCLSVASHHRREREFTGQVMKSTAPSFLICGSC